MHRLGGAVAVDGVDPDAAGIERRGVQVAADPVRVAVGEQQQVAGAGLDHLAAVAQPDPAAALGHDVDRHEVLGAEPRARRGRPRRSRQSRHQGALKAAFRKRAPWKRADWRTSESGSIGALSGTTTSTRAALGPRAGRSAAVGRASSGDEVARAGRCGDRRGDHAAGDDGGGTGRGRSGDGAGEEGGSHGRTGRSVKTSQFPRTTDTKFAPSDPTGRAALGSSTSAARTGTLGSGCTRRMSDRGTVLFQRPRRGHDFCFVCISGPAPPLNRRRAALSFDRR